MVHMVKDITILPSVLFLTSRGMGQGLQVINGISALVRCRLLWRTPLAGRASPALRKGRAWRIYRPASADLTVLHGRPHRVTAITATPHFCDPHSMIRSSHYCPRHQNIHINVFWREIPQSYLAVCRRWRVGVWASAESLFVCLYCWLGVITPSQILVVIQLCVFSAVGTECEVWGSFCQGAWLAEAVRAMPLCCHSLRSHCLCLKI